MRRRILDPTPGLRLSAFALIAAVLTASSAPAQSTDRGVLPTDASGRPLNFDFETGNLDDWTAEGPAFDRQPVRGDAVFARRSDMKSRHQGEYWIGTFEREADLPMGTLTSAPFKLTKPWISFLVAGGSGPQTRVEVVVKENGRVLLSVGGDESEELKRVAFDLKAQLGKELFIRLVDRSRNGWGHINFDDFRLHDAQPAGPLRPTAPSTPDVYAHNGLPPAQAAKAMTVPPGFKVSLFAGEPDVHQPIAFSIDDRGRLWVAEAFSYPIRRKPDQARDQIVIFEDTNGDGTFDKRKVFADKLNLVSGLELGFGGVFVGAAPQLLFLADKDGDDLADGPPEVLLDGWGYQDTHETLNTFSWGPDGWLYGCHGVFTHSRVGKPGTPDAERTPINAGIWRYHPTRKAFEVFAYGTSNPWGFDFDADGQGFLTSCVIPHLYHVIPGARYERQAGQHFQPYTYNDIKTIADHRHYLGANPHGGNGKSDAAGGGHAHSGAMIYQGDAWPEKYRGKIFMNNIHGARINMDTFAPKGSGFVGGHGPDFLLANDTWSQILNLKYGPDGQVYMIDWYDGQQCHLTDPNRHDRSNGRIYKITYGAPKHVQVDLKSLSDAELVKMQLHANEWYVRQSRRVLQERGPKPETHAALRAIAFDHADAARRLRALWTLYVTGGFDDAARDRALADASPAVRGWAIRLATEDGKASPALLAKMVEMAKSDGSAVVRLELASAAGRLPLADRWDLVAALGQHSEDAADGNLPFLVWYAAEPLAPADLSRARSLAAGLKIPMVQQFLIRRIGAIGTAEAIASLVDELGQAGSPAYRMLILQGLNDSLKGRRQVAMPKAWPEVFAKLVRESDAAARSQAMALALTFGDASALESARHVLTDRAVPLNLRQDALAALAKVKAPNLAPTLQTLVADPALRGPALRALAAYDDPATPGVVLAAYGKLGPQEKRDALNTLCVRVSSAKALLAALADRRVPTTDLSADLVRQLRNLGDKSIDAELARSWGQVRDTPAERAKLIASAKAMLTSRPKQEPDAMLGRAVYARTCQQCHTLFGAGGKVGPELTGSNRRDLDYVLANVLDPSALIGKDYQAHVLATKDGRVLTGIIRSEDKDAITLVTANETLVLPLGEVEERKRSDTSMMPDDLWGKLSEHEIRSLVAYLASPGQVPMLATSENVAAFFNGRDLTGWDGKPELWSVENGEIIGRAPKGLNRNEFLRSDLAAGDFKLTLDVKLVANQGNSGVQFRSEPLPEGEVKGYQADVGIGWWGKLYEEHGRALLWDKSGEAHVKPGEWNTYEITAVGPEIRTSLNGHPCVTLTDPKGSRRGIFAFQLHSGGPTEVRFRNLKLDLNPPRPAVAGRTR